LAFGIIGVKENNIMGIYQNFKEVILGNLFCGCERKIM
jgi:hypothetical protein